MGKHNANSCSTVRTFFILAAPWALAGTLLTALLLANSTLVRSQEMLKGPYVQHVTQTSIVIMWETDGAVASLVRVRRPGAPTWSTASAPGMATLHEVPLTGLATWTRYEYQVSRNGTDAWTASETFRTAPPPDQAIRLAAYGDSRANPTQHQAVVASMIDSEPDIVLHTGDLVSEGTIYAEWGEQFFAPAAALIANTPLFPVLGNHDRNASHYYDLFSLPGNERWYAQSYGPVRIIGLDTNADYAPSSEQYNWLVAELRSAEYAGSALRLVFFHRPPYTSGPHPGYVDVQNWLVPLFEQYGVDVVINGHNHNYERSSKSGIHYVVTGGGGAPLHGFPNWNPFSQVRAQVYHHVTLDVSPAYAMLGAWLEDGTAFDAVILSAAPVVGRKTVLYDGALNAGTPDTQGLAYQTTPLAAATQSFTNGATTLDTTAQQDDLAGYFNAVPITLDRDTGYAIRFAVRVVSETHASDHRAGFSVLALSNDSRGIELGFWENEVWAQEGGRAPNLFTRAESATVDTTSRLALYQLDVLGSRYALSIDGTVILSGMLRDYAASAGMLAAYDTPNMLFLGDDSASAQARVELASVSVIASSAPLYRELYSGSEVVIDDLGVLDLDADGQDMALTLDASHGVLTVTTGIAGGLNGSDITGNGTGSVTMRGTTGAINATLAHTAPLRYRAERGFYDTDIVRVQIADGDGSTGSTSIHVNVLRTGLDLDKSASSLLPRAGERITYTIGVTNATNLMITDGVISDTLPERVQFGGTIQLDPPGAGVVGTVPHIVTGLTISPWQKITVTLAVTVAENLARGTRIANTATLTCPQATELVVGQVTVAVPFHAYLPVIFRHH